MLRKRNGEIGQKSSWTADNAKIPQYSANENIQPDKSVLSKGNELYKKRTLSEKNYRGTICTHQAILDPDLVLAANASVSQLENVGKLMLTKEVLKESLQQHGLQISPVTRFDSTSFLDKGIDAIHGVGKLVEGFALSLDNVIGQAFEDWSSQKKSLSIADAKKTNAFAIHKLNTAGNKDKKDCTASSSEPSMALDQEEKKVSNDTPAGWGDFEVDEQFSETDCLDDDRRREKNKENRIKSGDSGSKTQEISGLCKHSPGTALQWQRKAQALQRELAAVKNSFKEYEKLREKLELMQLDLQKTSSEAKTLAEENSMLRKTAVEKEDLSSFSDHLATEHMLMRQMETLLEEKARLAQENDRLIRENTGLQELLEYTLRQSGSEYDHDEDNHEECGEGDDGAGDE